MSNTILVVCISCCKILDSELADNIVTRWCQHATRLLTFHHTHIKFYVNVFILFPHSKRNHYTAVFLYDAKKEL